MLHPGEDRFGRFAIFAIGGVAQRLRWIPPARLVMGSPVGEDGTEDDDEPQHEVELTRGFWLAETPCTQALWQAVMGSNPSHSRSDDRPVDSVSWDDCQAFLVRLATLVPGLGARMPTEAEWEHACRAGTTGATWAGAVGRGRGDDPPQLDAIAWYDGNCDVDFHLDDREDSSGRPPQQYPPARRGTHPVGKKQANPFGLHDMLGNVWELCEDVFGRYAAVSVTDPRGPAEGPYRVLRGGCWDSDASEVRAASRCAHARYRRNFLVGFRLARSEAPGT